jgi:hypothetical protein
VDGSLLLSRRKLSGSVDGNRAMVDMRQEEAISTASTPTDLDTVLREAQRREGELRSAISALSILLGGVVGVLERAGLANGADDFLFAGVAEAARTIQERATQDGEASSEAADWHFSPEVFRTTVTLVRDVARAVEREPTPS